MTKLKMLNMVELSTAHLHPLEAEKIKEVSYFDSDTSHLVPTIDECLSDCKRLYMVCLHDLLVELREKYNVDYVLFDADSSVCEEEFKTYDW
jgi:hypothetical protein